MHFNFCSMEAPWQGEKRRPSLPSASQSRAASPYRYHRRHLHGGAGQDRHGLPVWQLHDERKGTCG